MSLLVLHQLRVKIRLDRNTSSRQQYQATVFSMNSTDLCINYAHTYQEVTTKAQAVCEHVAHHARFRQHSDDRTMDQ